MSVVYKLGEGPINYDWNIRYVSIKGKELSYSLMINSEEKRTINLEGAITSNICRIKGNKYSFALVIPIFQVLFFSTDSYQETLLLRGQVIQAATVTSLLKTKLSNSSITQIETQVMPSINSVNQPVAYSIDFTQKIETWKREIVFDDHKYESHYIGHIQYSSPKEITNAFRYIYIDLAFYLLRLLIPVLVAYFILLYSKYNTTIVIVIFCISLSYMILMRISLFSYSSNVACSYMVKSKTIINLNKDKVVSVIRNNSLRSEWDAFAPRVHSFKENELRIGIDLVPAMNHFWFNLLMKINEIVLTKKAVNPMVVLERIEFKDKEGNDYYFFKNPESKGYTLYNEDIFEMFIVKSVKDVYEEKTLVVFVTNNDWRNYDMSYTIRQYMKEQRLSVVTCLREYLMSGDMPKLIESFL